METIAHTLEPLYLWLQILIAHTLEPLYFQPFPVQEGTVISSKGTRSFVRLCRRIEHRPNLLSLGLTRERTVIVSQQKRSLCCALPLPALSTDNESEGSGSLSSANKHEGKLWADSAKFKSVLIRIQRGLETLSNVYQETQMSKWMIHGRETWDRMHAWIKVPAAIFLPWFLFVSAFYGPSASMDLFPLWIIGPLVIGSLVKASVKMLTAFQQWIANRNLQGTALFVIEGARTGKLLEDACSKLLETKLEIAEKMSTWVMYVRTGRFIVVLRQYMHRKLVKQWEVWVERFQDWRLVYLRWERTVKNIV